MCFSLSFLRVCNQHLSVLLWFVTRGFCHALNKYLNPLSHHSSRASQSSWRNLRTTPEMLNCIVFQFWNKKTNCLAKYFFHWRFDKDTINLFVSSFGYATINKWKKSIFSLLPGYNPIKEILASLTSPPQKKMFRFLKYSNWCKE